MSGRGSGKRRDRRRPGAVLLAMGWLAGCALAPEAESPDSGFSEVYLSYFDSIDEMNRVYDRYAGHRGLFVDRNRWRLTKRVPGREKEAGAPLVDALFGPNRIRTRHFKGPGGGG